MDASKRKIGVGARCLSRAIAAGTSRPNVGALSRARPGIVRFRSRCWSIRGVTKRLLLIPLLVLISHSVWGEGAVSIVGAETAMAGWLKLIDDGKYAQSWEQAAPLFKKLVAQDQWRIKVQGARGALGALVTRARTTAGSTRALPGVPDGDYVVLHYATTFAKKQNAEETVTAMRDTDGTWRMIGYFLR